MQKQTRWLFILYIFFLLVPYLFAYLQSGGEHVFGGFLINPKDANTYLAKMYEGWRGEWGFTLPFTAEKGSGVFLFGFYLALGHLSRISGLSLILVFHLARLAGGVALFFSLQSFASWLTGDKPIWMRRVLGFTLFSSGLGWLVVPFGLITSDFWVAEAFPFLSGLANPHFSLGIALLLYLFRKLNEPGSIKNIMLLIASSLAMAIMMPFGIVIAGCVGGIWLLVDGFVLNEWRWRQALAAFIPGGLCIAYQYWVTLHDPLLSIWNAQNITPAPPVWDFLISFSPAWLLALWGIWKLIHSQLITSAQRLVIVWFISGILLIYAPLDLQRRFIFGYFIPVGILAMEGLQRLPKLSRLKQTLFFRIIAGLSLLTNGVVILIVFFGIFTGAPNYFLSKDEMDGFSYLRNSAPENALVLCSPETGNFLPGWTGRRVIYGHEFETVNALQNRSSVTQFFSGHASPALITQNQIAYIFLGPREKVIGTPDLIASMQPVYQNDTVSIYVTH